MAIRNRKKKTDPARKLNSPRYAAMFRRTRALADRALAAYGEPTMSPEELRRLVDASLPQGWSLSDQMLKDREAGW